MRKLVFILGMTFVFYFVVSYISASLPNFDTQSYSMIGTLTLHGKSIYPDPALSRHPYLPLFLYLEAFTQVLSIFFHVSQAFLIKIVLTFFHLWSVYAVYQLSKRKLTTALLYALNPISLLITAFHGQFDIIPVTCILFAILSLQRKKPVKTLLFLSLAVTIKTWPILFIIPFLKRIPVKYYFYIVLLPIISLLSYSLLFHTPIFSILRVLLVYQGVGGVWGLGKMLLLISTGRLISLLYKSVFVLGILLYSFKQKKTQIHEELFALLLLFFLFTPGFGLQWFLWLVPFFFLTKKPYAFVFMAGLTISLVVAYLSWPPFNLIPAPAVNLILFSLWPLFIIYYLLFFLIHQRKILS